MDQSDYGIRIEPFPESVGGQHQKLVIRSKFVIEDFWRSCQIWRSVQVWWWRTSKWFQYNLNNWLIHLWTIIEPFGAPMAIYSEHHRKLEEGIILRAISRLLICCVLKLDEHSLYEQPRDMRDINTKWKWDTSSVLSTQWALDSWRAVTPPFGLDTPQTTINEINAWISTNLAPQHHLQNWQHASY